MSEATITRYDDEEPLYRGYRVDELEIMYHALIDKGVDLDSDSSIAFRQGMNYALDLFKNEIEKSIERSIDSVVFNFENIKGEQ